MRIHHGQSLWQVMLTTAVACDGQQDTPPAPPCICKHAFTIMPSSGQGSAASRLLLEVLGLAARATLGGNTIAHDRSWLTQEEAL